MNPVRQLHTSIYTIYAGRIPDEGFVLAHGYTGAIDLVHENVVRFLRENECYRYIGAAPTVTESVVSALRERGYLTARTILEEREYATGLANVVHKTACRRSSFMFFVTFDCNFNCPYCFETNRLYHGSARPTKVLSKRLADLAFDAMLTANPDRRLHDNRILLIGGEPLMPENCEIVSHIAMEGANRGYTFGAVTNGYAVDLYSHLLKPGLMEYLQVTLDGPRETHDRTRRHLDGSDTFDKIVRNINLALDQEVNVVVRVNTSDQGRSGYGDLSGVFETNGWLGRPHFSWYETAVRTFSPTNPVAVVDAGSSRYAETTGTEGLSAGERHLACSIHETSGGSGPIMGGCLDSGLVCKIRNSLRSGKTVPLRSDFCGASGGMYIFDPHGDIYNCLESVGRREHRIGTFGDKIRIYGQAAEEWRVRSLSGRDCFQCKYLLFCAGGCPADVIFGQARGDRSRCVAFPAFLKRTFVEECKNARKN